MEDCAWAAQQLKLLLENTPNHAIFVLDPHGKVMSWNEGAKRIFGYRDDELHGLEIAALFTPEDRRNGIPEQERVETAHTEQAPDERWHQRKDGSRVFVRGVVRPLRDGAGHLQGFVKIAEDWTER